MKTILIVDDNYENLYLLKIILEQANFIVLEVNNGKEGLESLNKNKIDLIISDILMPVMDGYMFCQACKKNKHFKHIPFIFYTSTYTEKLDEDFALKLGAARFLRKPTDSDIIIKLIQEIFIETESNKVNSNKKAHFSEKEVLKLYSKRLISKLEQKEINLENEILERKQIETDLRLTKEFTEKLVMSMQEGLLIIDLNGKILMANKSFCDILGYTIDELVGLEMPYPFTRIEDFDEIKKIHKRIAKEEDVPSFHFEFIKKNGTHFLASFLTGNIKSDKGEVVALFGTMKDVSEEEKAKNLLIDTAKKSTEKKDIILRLANLVGEDFDTSLNKITKLTANTLNIGRVSIWSFNEDRTALFCEKLYENKNGKYSTGIVIKTSDNEKYFHALKQNKTIIVTDAQNDEITKDSAKDYLIPFGIKSLMDVFINSTDGFYGIMSFECTLSLKEWTADEQEFATSIASIVSLMVESSERKVAEETLVLINEELKKANNELNVLQNQLERENFYLRNELDLVFNYEEMVYGSKEFSNVLTEVEKVAPTNATVLLLGDSGTGKELLARAIHNTSLRNNKPLIKVNCSAIPKELIESELFGHKKGSFTGAFDNKIGKFELADEGTLFLDEIGDLPLDMQPKILRFLQEGEIEVVGGTQLKKLNVRVIAATNRDLQSEIKKKQFREDLYFRLNVFPINIPPLKNRKEDIPLLVEHFVDKFNKSYDKNIKYITDDSMNQLKSYEWPGNVRELENLIERASILSNSETLLIPGFESSTQKSKHAIKNKDLSLNSIQRNHILQVLEQCHWKISGQNGASTILDLKPSTLRDKMAKLGISKPTKK